jgi:hypothetical protein
MRYIAIIAVLGCYSPTSLAFLESLGASLASTAIWNWANSSERYQMPDIPDPVEEYHLKDKSVQRCDHYGNCTNFVSSTVIRRVHEYRYHHRPEWDTWDR